MKYRRTRQIGKGAFGTVFEAETRDGELVAIKYFTGSEFAEVDRDRFGREVRILSKLNHPNVLPVLDDDLGAEPPWFVMPMANCSLEQIVDEIVDEPQRRNAIFRQ